jgi:hypothetical protein
MIRKAELGMTLAREGWTGLPLYGAMRSHTMPMLDSMVLLAIMVLAKKFKALWPVCGVAYRQL